MQPTRNYVSVILDDALSKLLDYIVPADMDVQIGSRVVVPVGNSLRHATVWQLKESSTFATKAVHEALQVPCVLTTDLILLSKWIAQYYASSLQQVLSIMLPSSIKNHMEEKTICFVELRSSDTASLSKKQAAVCAVLKNQGGSCPLKTLLTLASTSTVLLKTLEKKGTLNFVYRSYDRSLQTEDSYFLSKAKPLSSDQQSCLNQICKNLEEGVFSRHLIYGITGSGKTEIYLQAISKTLSLGKTVIFLVPEILLTSQTIERLKSRFEEKLAILHCRLSDGERRDAWHNILLKKASIVVGARSAIFSPTPNLGLIIVDEEHDGAYKSSNRSPTYHARDVAIMRAQFCNATVILGSATPSLESYYNAKIGKYTFHKLSHRHGNATLAQVDIIDMKPECLKRKQITLFSDRLLSEIKKRIKLGEQTLLLLNRRGFHTAQICLNCSYISKCPACDANLTFHKADHVLSCHLCNFQIKPHQTCPSCKTSSSFKFRGMGTEFVEKQLSLIFPSSRILRMDADTTRKKGSHEEIFKKFKSGKADILIGTQMIAKGLHFPAVTLVGVLNADQTLMIPDFRATESLFALVTQVSGRAGRGELPGQVLLQSFLPDQPILKQAAKQDYDAFFEEEIKIRKLFGYPPFSHLIKISCSGSCPETTFNQTEKARLFLIEKLSSSFEFLPTCASGHAKINHLYRFQFLIKTPSVLKASLVLQELKQIFRTADYLIDIDPLSTFF